jgi:hypothetical protein
MGEEPRDPWPFASGPMLMFAVPTSDTVEVVGEELFTPPASRGDPNGLPAVTVAEAKTVGPQERGPTVEGGRKAISCNS